MSAGILREFVSSKSRKVQWFHHVTWISQPCSPSLPRLQIRWSGECHHSLHPSGECWSLATCSGGCQILSRAPHRFSRTTISTNKQKWMPLVYQIRLRLALILKNFKHSDAKSLLCGLNFFRDFCAILKNCDLSSRICLWLAKKNLWIHKVDEMIMKNSHFLQDSQSVYCNVFGILTLGLEIGGIPAIESRNGTF